MKTRQKISYEIDPHNRLIYKKTGRVSQARKYRHILEGEFEVNDKNALTYHVKKPQDSDIPQQVKLSGNYSLNKNHNLILTLDKWNNQIEGNKLAIKGELLDAKSNELAFSVMTMDSDGKTNTYVLKLAGGWQADRYNRLKFNVTKENGLTDALILQGAWEVNKQNEIIYTHTKSHLKTKEKITDTITFKGYWDVTERHRITYILNKEINSRFDFKVGLGRPAQRGLQYQVGIGSSPSRKILALFGEWKVNEKLGLLFEMPYEKGAPKGILFGAACKLSDKYNLEFKLKNARQENLGINLILSRKILKDQGEAFIRALEENKEISLLTGIGFRW